MSKEQTQFAFPPAWCGRVCKNNMSEICVEKCAIARNCSGFEPKEGLTLIDLPVHMPDPDTLSREEKFNVLYLYTSKLNDHIRGVEDEPKPFRRPRPHSPASSPLPANIEGEGVLPLPEKEVTVYQAPKEHTDTPVGSD
jgi:hypothetical protein